MVYTIVIKRLYDYFKWLKISLLGHSMGAVTGYTYTVLYPNTVDFLICFDSLPPHLPFTSPIEKCANNINEFLKFDKLNYNDIEPPAYSYEELISRMYQGMRGTVELKYCEHILVRNMKPSRKDPTKYYFARDPRLKPEPLFQWGVQDIIETASKVICPVLMCKCSESPYYNSKPLFDKVAEKLKISSKDFQFHIVPGLHHMHLNNPEDAKDVMLTFIEKHDIEDRSYGGITSDMNNILNVTT
jgi:pimeloyl-ACP methyl ester carboxylesterase